MSERNGGGPDGLAPVIPLFGAAAAPAEPVEPQWRSTWDDEWESDVDDGYAEREYADDGDDACGEIEREIAERNLLKRLRTRQLSVAEARAVVAERDLDAARIDEILGAFERLGYLDDAALAEQLIHAGITRKGHGRQVLAQTLSKRGIPRTVTDAALSALPDDDAERALDFARTKANSMRDLDHDVALRRLTGQLARRGYAGSVALTAAKQALTEQSSQSGVRFR